MKPIATAACSVVFKAEGCEDLPAALGDGFISTYWMPDAEELAAINCGIPVRISWPGREAVPIAVEVEAL